MNAAPQALTGPARRRRPAPTPRVVALDARRIAQALAQRSRYKYVTPRVLPEAAGWQIVSPNCSRNIDRSGGEIPIAWFEPTRDGRWRLHAHDHAHRGWVLQAEGLTLPQALAIVNHDSTRLYWP